MKTVDLIAKAESSRLHARDLMRIQAARIARMTRWLTITCVGLVAVLALTACGGGGGASASAGAASNSATVSPVITTQPANLTVTAGQVANFSVVASGSDPLQYQWKRNAVAIAGATSNSYAINAAAAGDSGAVFSVSVQNAAGTITSQGATLTVTTAASAPQITTTALPVGVVNSFYQGTLRQSGGTAPYAWSVTGGSLPAGLALNSTSGAISGTPTTEGTSPVTFTVRDAKGLTVSASLSIVVGPAATVVAAPFKHVVMVLMENTDYADVVGNTTDMPYLNSLISGYGLASKYYANTHPSIGNYFMLVTGQILTDDDAMTPRNFPVTVDNVVRQLEKNGKTWKAYAEDLPSVGYTGVGSGYYIVRHVPLAYLSDVTATTTSKQNLVPFTQFATDLAAGTLPNYSFVSPNGCNMAHDCSLATGDAWLKKNIAPLLTNTPFKDDGLLIIVFDEGNTDNTNGGGRVVANLVSPAFSKKGYVSTTKYQHESMLRLTLEGLGVTTFPGAAATAPRMWEFFNVTAP